MCHAHAQKQKFDVCDFCVHGLYMYLKNFAFISDCGSSRRRQSQMLARDRAGTFLRDVSAREKCGRKSGVAYIFVPINSL